MSSHSFRHAVGQLCLAVRSADVSEASDGELVERFRSSHEEAAIAALIRRHGPMVLGVCRRVLRNPHDADDAFQATFLVFVRKARSLSRTEQVAAWLHGVAYRTSLKARSIVARRRRRETQVVELPHPDARREAMDGDLRPLLDEELHRLPEKYRVALVLCELEGRGRKEVAEQLGWAEGTLSSRLARGREMLRRHLVRRGFTLAGSGALAALLTAEVSPALAAGLVRTCMASITSRAALDVVASAPVAHLTQGVLRNMFFSKTRVVLAMAVCLALAFGNTAVSRAAWPSSTEVEPVATGDSDKIDRDPADKERDAAAAKAIKALVPEAASSPSKEWSRLSSGKAEDLPKGIEDVENQSLSMSLMFLVPPEAKDDPARKEFHFLSETPDPARIAETISRTRALGYGTFLPPDGIGEVTCRVTGKLATGTVAFRGLYYKNFYSRGEPIYEGRVVYSAREVKGEWRIEEFRLPSYKLKVTRKEDGTWRQVKTDAEKP